MRYELPVGRSVKVLTLFAVLVPIAVFCWLWISGIERIAVYIALPLIMVFGIAYAFSPKEVLLEDGGVVIKKVVGRVFIPYSSIKDVSYVEELSRRTIRLFGSGGLFGWYGIFRVPDIGVVRIYARRTKGLVLIKADRNYLIAPEDPQIFIEELKSRIRV
ncbi:PH domain-containing protein [Archaeoglobus veneficus]|uniref:Bacterial Pleckstrin homology domain-containing protein n=1 Tax=Archaeoglobus veneficus (strain DSM 11195 / SNP6) TaxID=693661 RepID=F2KQG8_ARCVS|nr:PH domain-containing protein [Archaeoglobus veneficus]AEA47701.1 hypothetical protein Arcve_1702 [Archaeoglobus veneficus SNP6]